MSAPGTGGRSDRCPLCGAAEYREVGGCTYEAIFRALAVDWEARFAPSTIAENTPAPRAALRRCRRCRLEYFVPHCAGTERFYSELGRSPRYYDEAKWEFLSACERLRPGERVLDVGSGTGAFLELCRRRGVDAVGLEMSAWAVDAARRKGLAVACADLFDFARGEEGTFDAVTCFHVIEHIERPPAFVAALAATCRRGGRVFIAVPNNRSVELRGKLVETPLNCPPHHITRWAPENLRRLGARAGLVLEDLALAFDATRARWAFVRDVEALLGGRLGAPAGAAHFAARAAGRLFMNAPLQRAWRRVGLLAAMGYVGQAMLATYRKP